MRRMAAAFLIVCLFAAVGAQAASINQKLFANAKQAVMLMSYGEYKKAIKKLDFSSGAPTAAELKEFAEEELSDLFYVTVQDTVAVAYYASSYWILAIPIEEPVYPGVQAFALRSKNGKSFDAYKAMSWDDVLANVDDAEQVEWNEAYTESAIYIEPDEN